MKTLKKLNLAILGAWVTQTLSFTPFPGFEKCRPEPQWVKEAEDWLESLKQCQKSKNT